MTRANVSEERPVPRRRSRLPPAVESIWKKEARGRAAYVHTTEVGQHESPKTNEAGVTSIDGVVARPSWLRAQSLVMRP